MKKSIVVLLTFVGIIGGLVGLQNYDQHRLNQITEKCQSQIANAHLDGKSPEEVSAFLDANHIAHDPYSGVELILQDHGPTLKEGFIQAQTGPRIYLFKWPGGETWQVRMTFVFDEHNRFKSNMIYSEGYQ